MKKTLLFLLYCMPIMAFGAGDNIVVDDDFRTTEEILSSLHTETDTSCSNEIFSIALMDNSNAVSESDSDVAVRAWAKNTMMAPEVLEQILQCPEITSVSDNTTINFQPIQYDFPGGRNIVIKYSTQPQVLKHHILLSQKPSIPNGDASPRLMDPNDPAKYMNTEPAWYGIMVVQHGALDEFVGPGKNNTLSLKYIDNHIDDIYPKGFYCTSKSAIVTAQDTVNQVAREVVGLEDDSNEYYVAGDVNLEWVMYAEIAGDVLLTLATAGVGEAAMFQLKSLRAFKVGKNLIKSIGKLLDIKDVKKYADIIKTITKHTDDIAKLEKNIANAEKYERAVENLEKARRSGKDIAKYEKEIKDILEEAKKIDPKLAESATKMTHAQEKALADIEQNIARYEQQIKKLNGKNPSEAKKLRTKITNQKYERNKILNQTKRENPSELTKLDANKLREEQKTLQENIKTLEKQASDLEKNSKDSDKIKEFKQQSEALKDVKTYFKELHGFRRPQTGNVIVRTFKSLRAINTGANDLSKASRLARGGMSSYSAKISDWLFDATLKHGARLARFERDAGAAYAVVSFLGEMWDNTSSTSKEFSNGIEFKPLCLLSADDIKGQENVVNYGMWLMWIGDSTNPADDDAAYLQAMDFASKFSYKLEEYQDTHTPNCNVDVYVVRPIIRLDESNPDDPHGEMFYLFMNDTPWTTAHQF